MLLWLCSLAACWSVAGCLCGVQPRQRWWVGGNALAFIRLSYVGTVRLFIYIIRLYVVRTIKIYVKKIVLDRIDVSLVFSVEHFSVEQYCSIVSPSFESLGTISPMSILPEGLSVRMKVYVLVCTSDTSGFCVSVSLFYILIYRRSNPLPSTTYEHCE